MSIHARIKQKRLERGLSHAALGKLAGDVAWQTVQQWEKEGGTTPLRKRMPALAAALGVTVEWLETGHELKLINEELAEYQAQPPNTEKYYLTPIEEKMMLQFRELGPPQQKRIVTDVMGVVDTNRRIAKIAGTKMRFVDDERMGRTWWNPETVGESHSHDIEPPDYIKESARRAQEELDKKQKKAGGTRWVFVLVADDQEHDE